MTNALTDRDLDRLVHLAAPVHDGQLAAADLATGLADLGEAIAATPAAAGAGPDRVRRMAPRRLVAVAAVAAAALVAVATTVAIDRGGGGPAWAAPLVDLAESSPRLLLDAPGWEVSRADEYGEGEGEMTFVNGEREADLHWRAGSYDDWAADRRASAEMVTSATVLDRSAQVTRYQDEQVYAALWPDEGRTIELRAEAADVGEFESLLAALVRVDVDTWLSAMPESVIRSADRAVVVAEILADIDVPPGFDPTALESSERVADRYQLGAAITSAVGCGWVEQWLRASAAGDDPATREAVDAMAASHEWAILHEMAEQGAWSQVFWMVADGMAAGGTTEDGVAVEQFYGSALGCES